MNITEIAVTDRVLVSQRPNEKEVAIVKGITDKGQVIVRDSSGRIVEISPDHVIKKF